MIFEIAAALTRKALPLQVSLSDLGNHRLRGIAFLELIYKTYHPNRQPDFPPLISLSAYKQNLPVRLTSLIGRGRDLAGVKYLTKETYLLILLLVLGLALRVVGTGSDSLWTDEFHTLTAAREAQLLTTGVPFDQHPPLYYVLMQGVVSLGSSEFWLRLPSVLFGTAGIVFMWRIGHVLGNKRMGFLAAALYAFAPLLVWYSREARMYGMASFFWAASLYFYFRTLYSDGRFDFMGLMLTTLAAILTTYASFALWFLQMALVYWFWQQGGGKRARLSRWLLAQMGIAAGIALWWPFLMMQLSRSQIFYWQLPGPLASWIDLTGTLQQTLQRALVTGIVLLLSALVLSIWLTKRPLSKRRATQLGFILAVGALGALFIVTLTGPIQRGLSIRRQLLVLLPPLILLAAWALSTQHQRWLARLVIALTLAATLVTVASPPYENWRAAIDHVSRRIGTADVIVTSPSWQLAALDYYYDGNHLRFGANDVGELNVHRGQLDGSDAETAVFAPLRRVWLLVNSHPAVLPYSQSIRSDLAATGQLVDTVSFANHVTLFVYDIK
ncbi:MAG: glycosyltransferase family 39 protein [Candidatus Promineifilaceae bacterium]